MQQHTSIKRDYVSDDPAKQEWLASAVLLEFPHPLPTHPLPDVPAPPNTAAPRHTRALYQARACLRALPL
jgi:hypothetical protein